MVSVREKLMEDILLYRELEEALQWNQQAHKALENLKTMATELLFSELASKESLQPIQVVVAGAFNTGKSSFINSLLNEAICPVHSRPTTALLTRFRYGDQAHFRLNRENLSSTEFAKRVQHGFTGPSDESGVMEVFWPLEALRSICLVDTPGFLSTFFGSRDEDVTHQETREADVAFLVANMTEGGIDPRVLEIQEELVQLNPLCRWMLVLNWADRVPSSRRQLMLEHFQKRYGSRFSQIFLYSVPRVRAAMNKEAVEDAFQGCRQEILNTLMKLAQERRTIRASRHQMKLKAYAQEKVNQMKKFAFSLRSSGEEHLIHNLSRQFFQESRRLIADGLGACLGRPHEMVPMVKKCLMQARSLYGVEWECERFVQKEMQKFCRRSRILNIFLSDSLGDPNQALRTKALRMQAVFSEEIGGVRQSSVDLNRLSDEDLNRWVQRVLRQVLLSRVDWCEGYYARHRQIRAQAHLKICSSMESAA